MQPVAVASRLGAVAAARYTVSISRHNFQLYPLPLPLRSASLRATSARAATSRHPNKQVLARNEVVLPRPARRGRGGGQGRCRRVVMRRDSARRKARCAVGAAAPALRAARAAARTRGEGGVLTGPAFLHLPSVPFIHASSPAGRGGAPWRTASAAKTRLGDHPLRSAAPRGGGGAARRESPRACRPLGLAQQALSPERRTRTGKSPARPTRRDVAGCVRSPRADLRQVL